MSPRFYVMKAINWISRLSFLKLAIFIFAVGYCLYIALSSFDAGYKKRQPFNLARWQVAQAEIAREEGRPLGFIIPEDSAAARRLEKRIQDRERAIHRHARTPHK